MRALSPDSDADEPSEEVLLEQEFQRLQRGYRVLHNDAKAYREDARRQILKQKSLIAALESERLELDTDLGLIRSKQNEERDENNAAKLHELAFMEKQIIREIREEQKKGEDISHKIAEVKQKIWERKQLPGGGHDDDQTNLIAVQKRKRILENKLDKAVIQFNKQMTKNRALRVDIDNQRRSRYLFEDLYKKLIQQLDDIKHEIRAVIESTSAAFEQRDECQTKMQAIRERTEKDKVQHHQEVAELQRLIDHDNKIKAFMGIKNNERADLKAEEAAKKTRHSDHRGIDADREAIGKYDEDFKKIKEAAEEESVEAIIDNFKTKEKQNFALFNYVNELNFDVEKLQEDIDAVMQDIETCKLDQSEYDTGRTALIKILEGKYDEIHREAIIAEEGLTKVNKVLDELRTDVQHMFKLLGCDPEPIKLLLASEKGVTNKTVMMYMGQIEQRASHLINMLTYSKLKKHELTELSRDKGSSIKSLITPDYLTLITAPSLSDDRSDVEHDEDSLTSQHMMHTRPLMVSELRSRVMRSLWRKQQDGRNSSHSDSTKPDKKSRTGRSTTEADHANL